ncbi:MAG: hypothetical protein HPY60_09015 [Candidatus Methanofastidiosum sp.]|nr:hypothetical protein [Methanofastidiosum sp.]
MKRKAIVGTILGLVLIGIFLIAGCSEHSVISEQEQNELIKYPKIASFLAKKDEIINSEKAFDLVITGWITQEEANKIKSKNPNAILLSGLTVNWVYDSYEWKTFLTTVANYGKEAPIELTEDMYLHNLEGGRCAFGWRSDEFGTSEIYAMDPRSEQWADLIVSFYEKALSQPQHDGIVIDMVTEWSPCPDVISDREWIESTKRIMERIKKINKGNKLVIFNSGKNLSEIDSYTGYFDGYVIENALGSWGVTFVESLDAGKDKYIVIYAVDTENTGHIDLKRMRLGLTLSLLNDNTYFTYDFGPRDHGQAWWFPEYDLNLGNPLGKYYQKDNAYWREFENGVVVSSPYSNTNVSFEEEYTDIASGIKAKSFSIEQGDGRIFIK